MIEKILVIVILLALVIIFAILAANGMVWPFSGLSWFVV